MAVEKKESKAKAPKAAVSSAEKSSAEKMSYPVVDSSGKSVGSCDLDGAVFSAPVHEALVFDSVMWQLAKRRQGTHSCLTKGEMKGGGKKPWRQKGTGRARAGTNRSPLWVGGGVAHGPKSNPFGYESRLSKRSRRQGLVAALTDMANNKALLIVDRIAIEKASTKSMLKLLSSFGVADKKVALLVPASSVRVTIRGVKGTTPEVMAAQNLPGVTIMPTTGVNVWELLKCDVLLGERSTFEELQQQLQGRVGEVVKRNRRERPGRQSNSEKANSVKAGSARGASQESAAS